MSQYIKDYPSTLRRLSTVLTGVLVENIPKLSTRGKDVHIL